MVLLSIVQLGADALGAQIRTHLSELTGKDVAFTSLYVQLDRLTRKGLITGTDLPPTKERGGRRRRRYALTAKGREALRHAYEVHQAMWRGLSPDTLGPSYG
ncbi:MAG: hypothetical protein RhofKO_13660 [Rhodothermales bacterium]